MESVILQSPTLLLLYGIGLFFCLFDRIYQASGWWFSLISAAVVLTASALSLTSGASTQETVTVLLIFLLLNLR